MNFPLDEDEKRWIAHAKKLRQRAYRYELKVLRHWQKRLGQKIRKEKKNG